VDTPNQPVPSDDWITNPDLSLPPSNPPRPGIIKMLPAPDICVYDHALPALPGEIREVNQTYLEVVSRVVKDKGGMAFLAMFGTLFTLVALPLLAWAALQDAFQDYPWIMPLMLILVMMNASMTYPPFTMTFFAPEYEPIRFCRRERKVYCYRVWRRTWGGMDVYRSGEAEVRIYDWDQCRAELVYIRNKQLKSYNDTLLQLVFLDPLTNEVVERFPIGERAETMDFSTRVFLWETIRRYMENRSEEIPPPVSVKRRKTLGDYVDAFNPFSMPARFHSRAGRVFGYVAAILMWILLLPTLPIMIFNWLVRKAERKVDWGKFAQSVFRLAPNDPVLQVVLHPALAAPGIPRGEQQRRQTAARLWLASVALQLIGVSYFLLARIYHL